MDALFMCSDGMRLYDRGKVMMLSLLRYCNVAIVVLVWIAAVYASANIVV